MISCLLWRRRFSHVCRSARKINRCVLLLVIRYLNLSVQPSLTRSHFTETVFTRGQSTLGTVNIQYKALRRHITCTVTVTIRVAAHRLHIQKLSASCGATAPSPFSPFSACPFTSSSFPLFTFPFLSLALSIFFFCPSLSFLPRIVPLHFQAGGRRKQPNLGLVCFVCFICIF